MLPNTTAPPSLEKFAYEAIKKAILEFDLKPGDALIEAELSTSLGVSKTPIRDALSRLEKEGLVTKVPYTGTYVSEINGQMVADLFELRAVLEGLAASKAAQAFSTEDLEHAAQITTDHAQALAKGDLARAASLNREFHHLILDHAQNPRLLVILANLDDHLQRFRVLSNYQRGQQTKSLEEHKQILRALQDRDAKAAEAAMKAHLMSVVEDLAQVDIHTLIQQIGAEKKTISFTE